MSIEFRRQLVDRMHAMSLAIGEAVYPIILINL